MGDSEKRAVVDVQSLAELIPALKRRGFEVLGPTVRDGAVVYGPLARLEDLPVGWTDSQEPGRYRIDNRGDGRLFGYHPGPQSWKRYLHPAETRLFSGEETRRYALLGVRACELAAIRTQDRTLLEDRYPDPIYAERRRDAFIVAVNCSSASGSCFCTSMRTGPRVERDFDLALTEFVEDERHMFALEAGSARGAEVLGEIGGRIAHKGIGRRIEAEVAQAKAAIVRRVETAGLRELLQDNFEHPRWDEVAQRCLSCGNCTMVCPTCFCTTVEDVSDVAGAHAGRIRKWDSCFTQAFTYIHGGSVRLSARSRYRQWITHKFSTWIDQYGASGCVGCGRCITWCPAGIDVTAELAAIRETAVLRLPVAKEDNHGNPASHPGRT